jgi:hypothetical protein
MEGPYEWNARLVRTECHWAVIIRIGSEIIRQFIREPRLRKYTNACKYKLGDMVAVYFCFE